MPNIGTTDQNDLGILSNLPKASFVTNSEPRHNINREACPTKFLAGEKVLHAKVKKSVGLKTKLEGNGSVEIVNDEANISKPKQWWE